MLRVIAVERVYTGTKPVIACVYKDERLYVYHGKTYFSQKEYFENFSGLAYFVEQERYDWSDFAISKGDSITRNANGDIFVNDCPFDGFSKRFPEGLVSPVTLRLFMEFLKSSNKNNQQAADDIINTYKSGQLKEYVRACVCENPPDVPLGDFDKKTCFSQGSLGRITWWMR